MDAPFEDHATDHARYLADCLAERDRPAPPELHRRLSGLKWDLLVASDLSHGDLESLVWHIDADTERQLGELCLSGAFGPVMQGLVEKDGLRPSLPTLLGIRTQFDCPTLALVAA